jgi:aspartate racemase
VNPMLGSRLSSRGPILRGRLKEAKHIGILAGTAEGAALCYRTVCREAEHIMGRHAHPEITMHTFSLRLYLDLIERKDWSAIAVLMSQSSAKLSEAGADFIICPNNTLHLAFHQVISSIPWLHIAEVVAEQAVQRGYRRVAVLGTRLLMEGPVYAERLDKAGIEQILPEADDRTRIEDIILNELVRGQFARKAQIYLYDAITRMKAGGCEAVILGCTELKLLIGQGRPALPILDSTHLLARAAVMRATS